MTPKAKSIVALVDELTMLAINGTPIKMGIRSDDPAKKEASEDRLHGYQNNIKAHLARILSPNDEHEEALMVELGIKWNAPKA